MILTDYYFMYVKVSLTLVEHFSFVVRLGEINGKRYSNCRSSKKNCWPRKIRRAVRFWSVGRRKALKIGRLWSADDAALVSSVRELTGLDASYVRSGLPGQPSSAQDL